MLAACRVCSLRQWYLSMFNMGRKYGTVNRIDYFKDVFFPDGKHSTGRYCKLTELPYYEVLSAFTHV